MNLRREFIEIALKEETNRRELCRRYGISAKTGYALLKRYRQEGRNGLKNRSYRPLSSPLQTDAAMEVHVVDVRREHPALERP
jgi:transposase